MRERTQTFWDDVEEGQEVPGYALPIDVTRIVLQVSGSQDFFPAHHDKQWAEAAGLKEVFLNTRFIQAALGRLISDWTGPEGQLRKFKMKMSQPIFLGDEMTCSGRIVKKFFLDGHYCLEMDLWARNQVQEIGATATAVVSLPCRKP